MSDNKSLEIAQNRYITASFDAEYENDALRYYISCWNHPTPKKKVSNYEILEIAQNRVVLY